MECKSVADVVDLLRCEILDPAPGCIWSDKLLADFIQQAYTHIAGLRPDIFSESKEVVLEGGKCLQKVCDCIELVSIISIDGNDCDPPEKESPDNNLGFLNGYFGGEDCPAEEDTYNPSWFPVECGGCTAFRLSEEAPTDREVKAIICCAPDIDFCKDNLAEIELPDALFGKFYEGFKHLVLSKIYATDRKAPDLMELSQLHFKYWQDFRDWMFRTDFARRQSDWDLYRQQTNTDYSR